MPVAQPSGMPAPFLSATGREGVGGGGEGLGISAQERGSREGGQSRLPRSAEKPRQSQVGRSLSFAILGRPLHPAANAQNPTPDCTPRPRHVCSAFEAAPPHLAPAL